MKELLQRYAERILGTLSCFDRIILWGTLVRVSHPRGLCHRLTELGVRLQDFQQFACKLRDEFEQHLLQWAAKEGVEVEYLASARGVRKEDLIQARLQERGDHPGLVHIFAVVEPARVFSVRRGRTGPFLTLRRGKCKQFYLYFLDPQFGLCHLRISTWLPFWVQFYTNGHSWLALALARAGIPFTRVDNALTACGDWERAQALADAFPMRKLHQALDAWMKRACPVFETLEPAGYHWSITQAEYATDVVFRTPAELQALYGHLCRQAIQTVQATDVATFLERRPAAVRPEAAISSNLRTIVEGTRIRHQWGQDVTLKMYDKHGVILRIETTTNNVSFFRHHREVVHRDGTTSMKFAPMRKTLYSLVVLGQCMGACNRRYLRYLGALEDLTPGLEAAVQLAEPVREQERSYRGFNLLSRGDLELFLALARGEWSLRGFSNADLRKHLPAATASRVAHLLRRLRVHGLIDRVSRHYRYRLSATGQRVVAAALRLRQEQVVPALAGR